MTNVNDNLDPVALAYVAHGNQALDDKKLKRAFELFMEAVKLDSRLAEAWNNIGHIYQKWGKPDAACVCFTRACALIPNSPMFLANLGDVLWELKKYEASEEILRLCLAIDPKRAGAWHDLAMVHACRGDIYQALECCDKALEAAPGAVLAVRARALAYLYSGQYEKGFKEFNDFGADIFDDEQRFPIPQWDGTQDLKGKTLYIHCNQGIGDWIQFMRYVPKIADVGKITCDPPPEIVQLMDRYLPRSVPIEFRPMMGGLRTTAQYHVNLMALPYALMVQSGSATIDVSGRPYILVPPAKWDLRWAIGTQKKIGIVWGGNPDLVVDNIRSATIDDFVANLALPGVELYSLQFGERGRQVFDQKYHPLVRDMSSVVSDFCDTAALMHQMDAVVCVDTSCAHLAGAIGKQVHVLARSHNPDWRWKLNSSKCAWYDSATVWFQGRNESWSDVLGRLAHHLATNL